MKENGVFGMQSCKRAESAAFEGFTNNSFMQAYILLVLVPNFHRALVVIHF